MKVEVKVKEKEVLNKDIQLNKDTVEKINIDGLSYYLTIKIELETKELKKSTRFPSRNLSFNLF